LIKFSLVTGDDCLSINPTFSIAKFGLNKPETAVYGTVQSVNRLGHGVTHKCDGQSNRQTDRHTDSNCHSSLCCRGNNWWQ